MLPKTVGKAMRAGDVQGPPSGRPGTPDAGGVGMRLTVFRAEQLLGGYDAAGGGEVRLGRGRENHLVLPDPLVSRHHATLSRQGDRFLLTDSSTNGTFHRGKRVAKALVSDGEEFSIGPFRVRLGEAEPGWAQETRVAGEEAPFHGMLGRSAAMREVFAALPRMAASAGTVLILGETGSGKELAARAIHDLSPRAGGSFVALNCGAISPELVESELFGHEKGSFTGAVSARKGAFEQAHGGTLFLDEVGELPSTLQPRLLRALETGEVRRVGSQGTVRADARIVAATHRDLRREVEEGRFRADLLYRLFVLPLRLPSLQDRPEDVLLLAHHFLEGRGTLTPEVEDRLLSHPWPGNVRELKNVIERACILRGGEPIRAEDLIFLEDRPASRLPYGRTLDDLEKSYYLRALELAGGNIRAAARQLGIPKSTLFDRIRKHGLRGGKEEDGTTGRPDDGPPSPPAGALARASRNPSGDEEEE